jgi:hypothetical protein
MAKNILVFADGTGNEGGLLPDESRTNVYKLLVIASRAQAEQIPNPPTTRPVVHQSYLGHERADRQFSLRCLRKVFGDSGDLLFVHELRHG